MSQILKKSHKHGVLPHKVESGIEGIRWIDDDILKEYDIIDLEMKEKVTRLF